MIDIKNICIKSDAPIIEAMKIIEVFPAKIALVVDSNFKLVGTVTDGDVRRGLIKNVSVSDRIFTIMNQNPTVFYENYNPEEVRKVFSQKKISQVPILNKQKQVIEIVLSEILNESFVKDNHVVLMAGGLGTRLGSLTADCPKPMLKIGDKPILETVLENLKEHGFKKFHISVNYKAEMIEDYFGDGSKFGVEISYIREKERMGTAGSLSLINKDVSKPILVMNGDVLTKVNFSQFLDNHEKNNYKASMCVRKYDLQVPFGVVNVDQSYIVGLEEKPTQSFFVNAGIYLLNSEVIRYVPDDTYFDMPTLFNLLISRHAKSAGVFLIHEYWLDVGRKDDFNKAQFDFKKVF
jgi:dTDP-glucose pyrophosphorylase